MAFIVKDDLRVLGYAAATLGLRAVPRSLRFRWSSRLANAIGALWYRLDRPGAVLTRHNLQSVMGDRLSGDEVNEIARRTFQNIVLGKIVNDMLNSLPLEDLSQFLAIEGAEHLDAALAQGRGVVLLGSHFGIHGYASIMLLQHLGYPVTAVIGEEINPKDSWVHRRIAGPIRNRTKEYCSVVDPDGTPQREMTDALRQNRVLVIYGDVLDQDLKRLSAPLVVPVPFLGHSLPLKTGPFRLARWLKAPIVPFFVVPRPRGRAVLVEPSLKMSDDYSIEGLRADVAAYVGRFESYLLRHPALWAHWRRQRNSLPELMQLQSEQVS